MTDSLMTPDHIAWAMANSDAVRRKIDQLDAEDTLRGFCNVMWSALEPGRPFRTGWALDAILDHLAAVTDGHIKKLLMTVPPGFMKSLATNVFWPAWEWGPRRRPWYRYVGASYSESLTIRDNDRCRQVIRDPAYQAMWGPQKDVCAWVEDKGQDCDCGAVFHLRHDQDAKGLFGNNKTGWKLATTTGGAGTGLRGDRWVIDDPHSVKTAESDPIRTGILQWGTEVVATRKNDENSVFVLIMQRVHGEDLAGLYMEKELGFVHLNIPMRYEENHPHRWVGAHGRCHEEKIVRTTGSADAEAETERVPRCRQWGKGDPRTVEGELAWPERFSEAEVDDTERTMRAWGGEYAISGQFQQRPAPRGGGMVQRSDFKMIPWEKAIEIPGTERRGWDLAGSKKKTSPRTAGVRLKLCYDGRIIIMDARGDQWSPSEVEEQLVRAARWDGIQVVQDFPQDPGQAGLHQRQAFAKLLHGFQFASSPESGDKEFRARPFAAQVEIGNVWIVVADWTGPYLDEVCMFPRITRKDFMDATTRAYAGLVGSPDMGPFCGGDLIDPHSAEPEMIP